jgi:hypothetical protein
MVDKKKDEILSKTEKLIKNISDFMIDSDYSEIGTLS